ncbi:hypothetical protein KVR01_011813 [Diaporthe batatas]|uniref:uncharacterized protein n=1 Tax=Diaporthe batatas TaxID=748121 RepID=UPI001D03FDEA|nr:uncharacterized protein KVR01_011813 [Diaporthe batatas]KAG8158052.1 hypothetical protein KVR01_011813 [Diaporthe batatas]
MADTSQTSPAAALAAPFRHIRSCELCRHRKVKCDRQTPCSHCARAGQTCSYPAGPGRAPKRSRRAENAQLMDKLSRLEQIIKRLASEGGENADNDAAVDGHHEDKDGDPSQRSANPEGDAKQSSSTPSSRLSEVQAQGSSSLDVQFGRLVVNDSMSYYVGNVLWANLANEIDGIRDMVQEAEDDDSGDDVADLDAIPPESARGLSGSNATLFGFRALAYSLRPFHPTLPQAVNLFAVFTENVSPVLRLFHMPTLSSSYWEWIASLDLLDKNTEALLFAIYYSSCISLSDDQCLSIMGLTREEATEKYRFGVEQALARADLLNTHSMVLLQAAVLFLSALRNQDDSRTTWSLTALVFYVAQSMGLHRDGTVFRLKPFETELRRRLWWYICVLDGHSSKYQEHEANLHQFFSDTKLPLNINDSDLHPDMTEPPEEVDGWTDMTFCMVRCEAINTASSTRLIGPGLQRGPWRGEAGNNSAEITVDERKAIVDSFVERVTRKYLRHCNSSEPAPLMSAMVIKLIFARFWLLVYRPQPGPNSNDPNTRSSPTPGTTQGGGGSSNVTTPSSPDQPKINASIDPGIRDKLFTSSIEVVELSTSILTHPQLVKWTWYSKTYVQWHAIGYVLAEICCRPASTECDRAWNAVMGVYESGILTFNEPKGTVWKPIRRLMAKARYVREVQGRQSHSGRGVAANESPHGDSGGLPQQGPLDHTAFSSSTFGSGLDPSDVQAGSSSSFSGSADYLINMLNVPGDMSTDDFTNLGFIDGTSGFSLDMMGAGSAMDGWDGRMW